MLKEKTMLCLDNDIIFIKNIDNIVVSEKNIKVSNYKKLLAGVLVEAQEKVFVVCGVKNYKGEKFDLSEFVDHEAAFITTKTQNGVDIDALELPGLWNGSMAYWNSIFVEVPLETFNPVKTVNDLLKPVHQVS